MQDMTLETVVDYSVDFMRIMGNPTIFENKVIKLNIEEYRAELPEDFYKMIQMRNNEGKSFRYTTDSFHFSEDRKNDNRDLTYKIQGNILFTSIKEGEVELSYTAISVDECGFPMIPDNSSFTRALELYIKKQWFTILFDTGKISPQVLQQTLQDYAWAAGDCYTEFNRMTLDEAESFYNSWRTMIIRDNEHSYGFKNNGTKERLKVH